MTGPSPAPLHVELLATGDELLTGQILDTNSVWLMDRLWDLGVMARRKTLVADDREDLASALRETTSRSDLVVMSGGLGPTEDDLTAEVVAAAMGVPLEVHEPSLEAIRERFRKLGREMTPNNAKQARFPRGAHVVPNRFGTAPGFLVRLGRGELVALPGVPVEYRGLSEEFVLPRIAARVGTTPAFRLVKLFAVPESHADQAMRPVMDDPANQGVRFGYRAHWPEIHVKWSRRASSRAGFSRRNEPIRETVRFLDDLRRSPRRPHPRPGPRHLRRRHLRRGEGRARPSRRRPARPARRAGRARRELHRRARRRTAHPRPGRIGGLRPGHRHLRQRCQVDPGRRPGRPPRHPRRGLGAGGPCPRRGDPAGRRRHLGHRHHRHRGPLGGTAEKPVGTVYVALAGPEGTEVVHRVWRGDRDRVRKTTAYEALDMLRRATRG